MKYTMIILLVLSSLISFTQDITLVFFNKNTLLEKEIINKIKSIYHNKSITIVYQSLPNSSYSKIYKRYRGDSLVNYLSKGEIVIGVTNKDISVTKGSKKDWGVFGYSSPFKKAAIVSSYRIKKQEDVVSTVLHELGHLYNIPHCNSFFSCFMKDAEGKIIKTTYSLCYECRKLVK